MTPRQRARAELALWTKELALYKQQYGIDLIKNPESGSLAWHLADQVARLKAEAGPSRFSFLRVLK